MAEETQPKRINPLNRDSTTESESAFVVERVQKHLTLQEVDAIRDFIKQNAEYMDPQPFMNILVSRHIADTSLLTSVKAAKRQGWTNVQIWEYIVHIMRFQCTLLDIVNMLVAENELTLVQSLYRSFKTATREGGGIPVVQRVEIKNPKISRYFKQIKKKIHELAFDNPANPFEELQDKGMVLKRLIETETDQEKKAEFSDMYVALKAAQMDYLCNTSISIDPYHDNFMEMKTYAPTCSHPALAWILLHGRQGDALSTTKEFSDGVAFMRNAYVEADFAEPCVEIIDMMYKNVVFKLAEFEENPTTEAQNAVFTVCEQALQKLQNEDEDIQEFWKRVILLRRAYAYLGVGKHSKVMQNYWPDERNIQEAEKLLRLPIMKKMEVRRMFFKYVAKARFYEVKAGNAEQRGEHTETLQSLRRKALKNASKAESCATKGKYSELSTVSEYKRTLCLRWQISTSSAMNEEERKQTTLKLFSSIQGISLERNANSIELSSAEPLSKEGKWWMREGQDTSSSQSNIVSPGIFTIMDFPSDETRSVTTKSHSFDILDLSTTVSLTDTSSEITTEDTAYTTETSSSGELIRAPNFFRISESSETDLGSAGPIGLSLSQSQSSDEQNAIGIGEISKTHRKMEEISETHTETGKISKTRNVPTVPNVQTESEDTSLELRDCAPLSRSSLDS